MSLYLIYIYLLAINLAIDEGKGEQVTGYQDNKSIMILFDKDFLLLISCWGTLGEFGRLCSCIGKTCLDPWIFYDIFFIFFFIFYEVTAYLQWLHLFVKK